MNQPTSKLIMPPFDLLKVLGNALRDSLSRPLIVFPHEPFNGIAITLGVVATAKAVAKWNDIVRRCSWTICRREWHPMIGGYGVPQSRRSTADGAAVVEIVKGALPVGLGEGGRKGKFASQSALILRLHGKRIIAPPFKSVLVPLFSVNCVVFRIVRSAFFAVVSSVLNLIGKRFLPALHANQDCARLAIQIFSVNSGAINSEFNERLLLFAAGTGLGDAVAFFTAKPVAASMRTAYPAGMLGIRKFLVALRADRHSASLSPSPVMSTTRVAGLATSSGATLDRLPIIPQRASA